MSKQGNIAREVRVAEKAFFDQYLLCVADGLPPDVIVAGLGFALARVAATPDQVRKIGAVALEVLELRKKRPFTTPRDPLIRKANLKQAV